MSKPTVEYRIGDFTEEGPKEAENSFDGCVTDPPYGLSFMGKEWDNLIEEDAQSAGGFGDGKSNNNAYAAARIRYGHGGRDMQTFHERWLKVVFKLLKPGAHLVAFGGSRTYHRLAVAAEEVGFEVRDSMLWIYGQGYPKNLDAERALDMSLCSLPGRHFMRAVPAEESRRQPQDHVCPSTEEGEAMRGWGTALKPAFEPILLARKPMEGSVGENTLMWGTGALNINAARVVGEQVKTTSTNFLGMLKDEAWQERRREFISNPLGRYPTNVILTHSPGCEERGRKQVRASVAVRQNSGGFSFGDGAVKPPMPNLGYGNEQGLEEIEDWECVDGCPVAELNRQSPSGSTGHQPSRAQAATGPVYAGGWKLVDREERWLEGGGAARFFYVAKASREERELGLGPPLLCQRCERVKKKGGPPNMRCLACGKQRVSGSPCRCAEPEWELVDHAGKGHVHVYNPHPTVKPLTLMRYLVRLVIPTGGRVLEPFSGSGTTLLAARFEGVNALGFEKELEYEPIIRGRLEAADQVATEEEHQREIIEKAVKEQTRLNFFEQEP